MPAPAVPVPDAGVVTADRRQLSEAIEALVWVAQFCSDKLDLEQTVKWGEEKIKAICAKFA